MIALLAAVAAASPVATPAPAPVVHAAAPQVISLTALYLNMTAMFVVATGATYLVAYLVKTLLRGKVPDDTRRALLKGLLWVFGALYGAGAWLGLHSPPLALAAVLGVGASTLLHDVIDSIRSLKER